MRKTSRFALLALSLLTIPAGAAFAQNETNDGSKAATARTHHTTAAKHTHHKAKATNGSASTTPSK